MVHFCCVATLCAMYSLVSVVANYVFEKALGEKKSLKKKNTLRSSQPWFVFTWSNQPHLFYQWGCFDQGLLKKYTVKVLHIIHKSSLGSAKFSSIWIMDYLWKIHFLFHIKVGWNVLNLILSWGFRHMITQKVHSKSTSYYACK